MKRISMICFGALAIVMAGCSKNAEPEQPSVPLENAWMFDETLPVPIQFGMSTGVGLQSTKTMVNTWDDLGAYRLGIFALNLDGKDGLTKGSYDVYLDNEPADCVFDEARGKDMIKFDENKYYPYASDRNLSFFGYYPYFGNAPEYTADNIRIPIPAEEWGRHDVLCASAFADTMYVKKDVELGYFVPVAKDLATHFYNGYNATYMRFLNRNGIYEEKMPNLVFKHKTTCFVFDAYLTNVPTDKVTDFDQVPVIQSIEISGESIYEKAYLEIAKKDIEDRTEWSGSLTVAGANNGSLKLGGKNAGDLNSVPGQIADEPLKYNLPDNQFFLQPMDASEKLTIKITLENPYNKKREVFEAEFPAIPEEVKRFEEGKYYPFTITINYFAGVEISASLDPWKNGWDGLDTENDKIGEDAPSGTL